MTATRRDFVTAAAAGSLIPGQAPLLPTVRFGGQDVTRLILGTNPMFGYSHVSMNLDLAMREWMTHDRRVETVLRAERAGINTWQLHYHNDTMAMVDALREQGSKIRMFLLSDFELHKDFSLIPPTAKRGFIGMAHHGNRTDEAFRERKMDRVREFVLRVRDTGVMAGVSAHNPEALDYIESAGWPVDYYMTCFYRVSRTVEETRSALGGEAPLGEAFLEGDPDRMTRFVRLTKRPCLGFKVLGAGHRARRREHIETAFRYAFSRMKPSDAVIVGMFPRYRDEVGENVEVARAVL
ncbi:MAG: hypothetical protein M9913_00905 [Bryobacteraceae bacterium]|nr:hypothetical protein [Solibacteraceae bacterium]MCL4840443.1 hypothetical protein [Bryobacteraceae bacterium]MCO5349464.1 hypothetical protein [Bryobacteraceae bacterium]